jgi:hypothetical protein
VGPARPSQHIEILQDDLRVVPRRVEWKGSPCQTLVDRLRFVKFPLEEQGMGVFKFDPLGESSDSESMS